MSVSPGTWPVIAGAVLAANGPDAIRIGVLLPRAAARGNVTVTRSHSG